MHVGNIHAVVHYILLQNFQMPAVRAGPSFVRYRSALHPRATDRMLHVGQSMRLSVMLTAITYRRLSMFAVFVSQVFSSGIDTPIYTILYS